jgi:asparagine synthase (glutamine-hydrolysing)
VGNRLRNFAYRGDLANPERLYSDDALAADAWDALLGPRLRGRVERGAALEVFRDHWDRVGPVHEIDRLLYVDLKTAIWGNDLVKVMSAARVAGIRVRFPFLDPVLASFTGRLGPAMKVRRLTKRYLFRRAVEGILPPEVIHKPKHGFSVPVREWIRGHRRVRDAVLGPILDSGSLVRDCVSGRGLQRLVDEHLHGLWDHSTRLWALMMLARWHRAGRCP